MIEIRELVIKAEVDSSHPRSPKSPSREKASKLSNKAMPSVASLKKQLEKLQER